jgi:hypothetical protein
MTKIKMKPLMFLYLLFFLFLAVMSIRSDIRSGYHVALVGWACIHYAVLTAGIILYSLRIQTEAIKSFWKYAFPLLVIYFFASLYFDSLWGENRNVNIGGVWGEIAVLVIGVLLFFPAFRASFFLAYRSLSSGAPAPQQTPEYDASGGYQQMTQMPKDGSKSNYKAIIITAIATALGGALGTYGYHALKGTDSVATFDKLMANTAEEFNKTLPMMVDKETRLNTTMAGPGNRFTYSSTLVNYTKEQLDSAKFVALLRPGIIASYKSNDKMRLMREKGTELHYQYSDKNGVFLTDIVVSPKDF